MVIINAGCQGHVGDPAAAWLPQLILPAEALCLLTALPMLVSVERMACMEKTRSRERNHSAIAIFLLWFLYTHSFPCSSRLRQEPASLGILFSLPLCQYWPAHRFPWSLGWVDFKQPMSPAALTLSPRSLGRAFRSHATQGRNYGARIPAILPSSQRFALTPPAPSHPGAPAATQPCGPAANSPLSCPGPSG